MFMACLQNPQNPANASPSSSRVLMDAVFVLQQEDGESPAITTTALLHLYNRSGIVFNQDEDKYAVILASVSY